MNGDPQGEEPPVGGHRPPQRTDLVIIIVVVLAEEGAGDGQGGVDHHHHLTVVEVQVVVDILPADGAGRYILGLVGPGEVLEGINNALANFRVVDLEFAIVIQEPDPVGFHKMVKLLPAVGGFDGVGNPQPVYPFAFGPQPFLYFPQKSQKGFHCFGISVSLNPAACSMSSQ